ncbi:hypothetical protein BV898_16884 [Hypsibius exemplaris]|uniref:Uncharacterized protein n=1 Tax=Hypsibius exemplaris TaxID=2072580 RepID=A0A9X6NEB7_HYPEX|nr:hypothetical protein BV898_16884 [Hypsibius exemplaris]
MKLSIDPPRNLNIPVLPMRCNHQLVFTLCRTCAETLSTVPCKHSKDQRKLIGTWCTPEIHKALDKGYVVDEIKEVGHFPEHRLGLFAPYIDPFYKIKTESSGYPAEVVTEEEKDRYIASFEQHEGIKLDKAKIKENKGMRCVSKLFLNSF